MAFLPANFPHQIWDGLSANLKRLSRLDDVPPSVEDWDQIVTELVATQTCIRDVVDFILVQRKLATGATSETGATGPDNGVPDPSALGNGAYVLTVTEGVATWTAHT